MKSNIRYVIIDKLNKDLKDIFILDKENFIQKRMNLNINFEDIYIEKIELFSLEELFWIENFISNKNNIFTLYILYETWTYTLDIFFKNKQIIFESNESDSDFLTLAKKINFNDLLSLINILESKRTLYINNFIVYLIINSSNNLSLKIIELYFKDKNNFKTILLWFLTQNYKGKS